MRFTIKGISEQLEKISGADKVYIFENGVLFIHKPGGMVPQSIYSDSSSACDVTDIYQDWLSGAESKENTARLIKEAAEEFYN